MNTRYNVSEDEVDAIDRNKTPPLDLKNKLDLMGGLPSAAKATLN